MGEVYDAFDEVAATRLAIKVLRREMANRPVALDRLRSEVQLARRVSHRNVSRIFDLFTAAGPTGEAVYFLTMERLEGPTLDARVNAEGRLSPTEGLAILEQVAAAIDASHAEGVVHCDIKASNVVLVPRPDGGVRAVLTDFGIARSRSYAREVAAPRGSCGTPSAMAPEQREGGEVGPAVDIYALGKLIASVVSPPRSRVRRRWGEIIACCLETDPADRPLSAAAVVTSLGSLLRARSGRMAA
jgi:serine/threonine protein kinase